MSKFFIIHEFRRSDLQKSGDPTEAFLRPAVEPLHDAAKARRSWDSNLGETYFLGSFALSIFLLSDSFINQSYHKSF